VYNFTGKNGDGATPCSGVVMSATGTLYGTTLSGGTAGLGTVYELTPPGVAGGAWSETVIHSFTNQNGDGAGPFAGLAGGSAGALYGTTYSGGASKFGTVFRLAPPTEPDGRWTETILYSFTAQNGDGATPYAPVAIGANGKLYGTTYAGGASGLGTIYEVAPPATSGGPWTESVLYSFSGEDGDGSNPYAGAVISNNGTLYGTTQFGGNRGLGSLFELAPPSVTGAGWIKVLLHTFSGGVDGKYPVTGLVIGASGGLYGATTGGGAKGHGTVFDLKR